ncbi:TetR/AcrR family transcriptional regulator [Gammaproteobacteria bacterium]|nr:TetR/AcrR family transcriptional regulator [Gammaproteobacteria bacterium]MDC1100108.1 TetR/AcrR family transcriptional regulator [Gammaproteobacteria bacterium]
MNKVSKLKTIKSNKTKGRQNVEKKLIESAAVLVGSIGPNQLTIRDIADHAGVNHAQIHHYFGGKDGLLTATYKLLAFEHIEQLQRRNVSVDNLISEPLGDITNNYFKGIIRAVLDNRMDLVRVQVDSNLSMSKKTLDQLVKLKNEKKPTAEMKAAIAIVMVVEFGLASMKPYIMEVLDINEKEMKKFMDFFFKARQSGLNEVL